MANKLKLSTKDESFNEILANGKKYFVPRFQRDYSWEEEHWQELWEDIKILSENPEEHHYMGYLVLQESERIMQFKIIDGQQRLTTFSLLVLAAVKRLKEISDESKRVEGLLNNFIGSEDLVHLRRENKLKLNRNNDFYYRRAVSGYELPRRGGKKTINLMRKALDYFYERFAEYPTGVEISMVIQQMAQRMLFTTIYIGDELNAYKVFETLNARGVKLSSADLLKNYLFSLTDPLNDTPSEVLDELDEKWEKIGEDVGNKSYTDYILTEWNSNHLLVRQSELFKKIRIEINDGEKASYYLDKLVQNSQLYSALLKGEDEFWKDSQEHIDIKKNLNCLSLFSISQPHSLLMVSYLNFKDNFHKVLNWIKVFSLRYNVICREHTGEQERLYSNICVDISRGCKLFDVKEKLLKLYPKDETFKQHFVDKTIPTKRSNKKARYLLARLEGYNDTGKPIDEEQDLTVEHILPLNPNEAWCDSFGDNWNLFNQRLGNMALVSSTKNKELDQKTFDEKKEILFDTPYNINKNVSQYSEWNPGAIESRQRKLAEIAVKLWRIDL